MPLKNRVPLFPFSSTQSKAFMVYIMQLHYKLKTVHHQVKDISIVLHRLCPRISQGVAM